MQNPFWTEKDWLIPQRFFKAILGTSLCFHTVCALFSPLTSWCITQKDAGGSLLLWGEDIVTHFSYDFSHALPAATAPAGVLFLSFLLRVFFFIGLSSVLNFTIQKCYLAQALKKSSSLLRQAIDVDREVLPQLPKFKPKKNSDREESKQNKFLLVIHFSQTLILILTWILSVVRDKLLREDIYHSILRQQGVWNAVICFYYCIYLSIL